MNSYLTVKFQNLRVVTRSVPCSPGFTVFLRIPPSCTVQLLCPFGFRSFQPVVSLPLKRGLNPSPLAAGAALAKAKMAPASTKVPSLIIYVGLKVFYNRRIPTIWTGGQHRPVQVQAPILFRPEGVADNRHAPRRTYCGRERCRKLFLCRIVCTRKRHSDPPLSYSDVCPNRAVRGRSSDRSS